MKYFYFILLCLLMQPLKGQELNEHRFENLPGLQAREARPVLIYLSAEWCTYCRQIEQTSYTNNQIVKKLNRDFYFINFDIEEREDIRLGSRTYSFKATGLDTGVHELAQWLGKIDGVLSTPTFIIMSPTYELLYRYGGFLDTTDIKTLLESVPS